MVCFPRDRDFNLAKDTPLPPSECARVAHWDTIAVLPEWRDHGLARLMNTGPSPTSPPSTSGTSTPPARR
jgi:hypothetical protein